MALMNRGVIATLLAFHAAAGLAGGLLPPEIAIVEMGAGRLFVNGSGHTLYTFKRDREQPGTSVCNFGCEELWPPVTAAQDATPLGDWSVVERQDGSHQWAHKDRPVYAHTRDRHPGAMVGEKAGGFWDVMFEPADTPPGIAIRGTLKGQTLVDMDGQTVYANVAASCDAVCMEGWLPLEAPWLAGPIGEHWTTVRRADGLIQWAYKNHALFIYSGDHKAGNVSGEDPKLGWQVMVVQDAPSIPDWVTFQETDFGAVFADPNRMTLYYLPADPEQIRRETCNEKCVAENWTPVAASASAKPIGNWSIDESAYATQQWFYLGFPVFTYKHDNIPGDTRGDKFAGGANIRGGWQAIRRETLIQKLF